MLAAQESGRSRTTGPVPVPRHPAAVGPAAAAAAAAVAAGVTAGAAAQPRPDWSELYSRFFAALIGGA